MPTALKPIPIFCLAVIAALALATCVSGDTRSSSRGLPPGASQGDDVAAAPAEDGGASSTADEGTLPVEDEGTPPVEDEGTPPVEDEGSSGDRGEEEDLRDARDEDQLDSEEATRDHGEVDAEEDGGGAEDGGEGARWRHACDDDTDCQQGRCRAIPEGGNRFCVGDPHRRVHDCEHLEPGFENECCADDDCAGEGDLPRFCVAFEVGYCGGPAPMPINVCRSEGCLNDSGCGDGKACAPGGFWRLSWSTCVHASCAWDGDCTARAGGQCRPFSGAGFCDGLLGFFCTYADDPCRTDADCPAPKRCVPAGTEAGGTGCVDPGPPPP